jgi:NAD(P)-dependent dehydrogenase (short-subunit alcohol dehydrogenase family)
MSVASRLFDVSGKSALITGATGAFGKMAARTLADGGAKLTLAAGTADALAAVEAELRNTGAVVQTVARRPDTESDAEAMVDAAVSAHGGIDLVVTAAGINKVGLATEQSVEDWESVVDANARGTWLVCRAAGRRMIDAGARGKFVLLSSTRSELGHPAGYTAYCASKAAVNLITKALACEWGQHGINVNAIAPTVFRSPLTEWMFGEDENATTVRDGFLTRIPLGRLGEPEDFAGALLYFLSRASDFCTGQVLYVDGGYSSG